MSIFERAAMLASNMILDLNISVASKQDVQSLNRRL